VALQITAKGGRAHTAVIDTLDDAAVNQYIDGVVKQARKIEIVVDAAGPLAREYGNGKNAVDLPIERVHGAAGDDGQVALHHCPAPPRAI